MIDKWLINKKFLIGIFVYFCIFKKLNLGKYFINIWIKKNSLFSFFMFILISYFGFLLVVLIIILVLFISLSKIWFIWN